jgi:hypothetical protein
MPNAHAIADAELDVEPHCFAHSRADGRAHRRAHGCADVCTDCRTYGFTDAVPHSRTCRWGLGFLEDLHQLQQNVRIRDPLPNAPVQ